MMQRRLKWGDQSLRKSMYLISPPLATHRLYPRNLRPNALATALLVSLTVSRNLAYSRRNSAITRAPALRLRTYTLQSSA